MDSDPANAIAAYWSIGGSSIDTDGGRISWHPTAPTIDLGNVLTLGHGADAVAVTSALRSFQEVTGVVCTKIIEPADADPATVAQLAMADWTPEMLINLVLDAGSEIGGDRAAVGAAEVRLDPVRTDADWATVRRLFRIDHQEEDDRTGRPRRPERTTELAVELRRSIATRAGYFLARSADEEVGTIALWTPADGDSVIEDVFVHPDHRHRGIATAMITQLIQRSRAAGNPSIVIAAEAADTPKQLYAALGFAAVSTTRIWTRAPSGV